MDRWVKIGGVVLAAAAVALLQQFAGAGPKPQSSLQGDSGSYQEASNKKRNSGDNTKGAGSGGFGRDRAGDFDYYALVLSWSPTYCLGAGADRDEPQCSARRPYAFVLHGLWPQYNSGYPSDCDTGTKPWVDQSTIDGMMDIMPSRKLIIHEYKKHGTCSGLASADYFSAARKMFKSITIPAAFREVNSEIETSAGDITREFLKANPGLKADSFAVDCAGRGGRLREVRFCFSKDGKPRSCGRNEAADKLCRSGTVTLPPTRG
jgi:ribonuclease T2